MAVESWLVGIDDDAPLDISLDTRFAQCHADILACDDEPAFRALGPTEGDKVAELEALVASLRSQNAAQVVELANVRERAAAEARATEAELREIREALTGDQDARAELARTKTALNKARKNEETMKAELEACRDELRKRGRALAAARGAAEERKRAVHDAELKVIRTEKTAKKRVALATEEALRAEALVHEDADKRGAEVMRLRDALKTMTEERSKWRREAHEARRRTDAAEAAAAAARAAASLVAAKAKRRDKRLKRKLDATAQGLERYFERQPPLSTRR